MQDISREGTSHRFFNYVVFKGISNIHQLCQRVAPLLFLYLQEIVIALVSTLAVMYHATTSFYSYL
jgi:hypothetical protein